MLAITPAPDLVAQVDALMQQDTDAWCRARNYKHQQTAQFISRAEMRGLLYAAWLDYQSGSLFATLPGCGVCLTEYAAGLMCINRERYICLDMTGVPRNSYDLKFDRDMLMRFAVLQTQVRLMNGEASEE